MNTINIKYKIPANIIPMTTGRVSIISDPFMLFNKKNKEMKHLLVKKEKEKSPMKKEKTLFQIELSLLQKPFGEQVRFFKSPPFNKRFFTEWSMSAVRFPNTTSIANAV